MINRIFDFLKRPGYIEKKTVKIELSTEEFLKLVKEGKIKVKEDGDIELIDQNIKDLDKNQYTISQE